MCDFSNLQGYVLITGFVYKVHAIKSRRGARTGTLQNLPVKLWVLSLPWWHHKLSNKHSRRKYRKMYGLVCTGIRMTIHAGCGLMDQERHTLTGMMENPMTMEEMRIARTCFPLLENGMICHVPKVVYTFVKARVGDMTIVCLMLTFKVPGLDWIFLEQPKQVWALTKINKDNGKRSSHLYSIKKELISWSALYWQRSCYYSNVMKTLLSAIEFYLFYFSQNRSRALVPPIVDSISEGLKKIYGRENIVHIFWNEFLIP